MKTSKFITGLSVAVCLAIGTTSTAQNLNVTVGNVSYSFPAERCGEMQYTDGLSLQIMGRSFNIDEITVMEVATESVDDNMVNILWTAEGAKAVVAGNVAQYVQIDIEGGNVTVTQSDEVGDETCGEISYVLSGESSNGSLILNGSYKASVELNGLTLTNPNGAAIDIENGKRTALRVNDGTTNILTDGAAGSQKAALYCKGHLEFKKKGSLTVTGNKSHAIAAKEYIEIKNSSITIAGAKKDGINCNQYFMMESGKLNISGTEDDGIQVAYKDATDREAEDTGTITIKGGTLDIDVTADAAKALKGEGDFVMTAGTINAVVRGNGLWDSSKLKTKASSCIGVDGNLNISGGTLNLTATGGGGKGISIDGDLNISGGDFTISTEGGMLAYVNGVINNNYTGNADNLNSDYKSSPKGIKVDGTIVIDGGNFLIETKGAGGEGMESKKTLTVNDGTIVIHAYEDGTNSSSHTYINGGNIEVTSKTGDAIDSNGAIYIKGGMIRVFGAGGAEQGFDAGDNYTIYFNGGTMLAAGGGNSAPTNSQSTQAYVVLTQQLAAGTTVTISDGDTELATFEVPASYGATTSSVMRKGGNPGGGWDWGWGGSTGSALLISTPEMVSGKSYTIKAGSSTVSGTAQLTGGSSGPGGGRG